MNRNKHYSKEDYEFMNSLNAAIIEKNPKKLTWILWFWVFTVACFLVWAYFSEIDEIVRGEGKIIPSNQNKIIQNLEGGIIEKIYVKEGDFVRKGDILIRIDNKKSTADLNSTSAKLIELEAKKIRLQFELEGKDFVIDDKLSNEMKKYLLLESELYKISKQALDSEISILKSQLDQVKNDLIISRNNVKSLNDELNLINEEIDIVKPLVDRKLKSQSEILALKKELNRTKRQLDETKSAIVNNKLLTEELNKKIQNAEENFKQSRQEELNEISAEIERIDANMKNLKDRVFRTNVYSPNDGIVQKIFFNTIGGVVKPGESLVEIVPTEENLIIEAKIKPADIAFIHYEQDAKVKFTAYDYAIYGGLDGKVIKISPDTEVDDKTKESYYTIQIQTANNHLEKAGKQLPIIPGMIVNIDILTGKKTVLDYILKPILRAKDYTFTER